MHKNKHRPFTIPKMLTLVVTQCLLLVSFVNACLETKETFADIVDGATSFDEYDYLTTNYQDGMVVDKIQICQADISGFSYLVGIKIDLISRSTGVTSEGTYHGMT